MDNLKNSGKSMIDMMSMIPQQVHMQIAAESANILDEALSQSDLEQYHEIKSSALQTFSEIDFSKLDAYGFDSKQLLDQQIEWAAAFAAFTQIRTEEAAVTVFRKIVESTYPSIFSFMMPDHKSLEKCSDPFLAFSNWFNDYMDANQEAGLFKYKLIHKDADNFQFTCSWCVWHQIHQILGTPKACEPICYADLNFFPGYCEKIGAVFNRPSALSSGSICCDFNFSRKSKEPSQL